MTETVHRMREKRVDRALPLVLAIALFAVTPAGAVQPPSTERPAAFEGVGVDPQLGKPMPLDLEFRTESGEVRSLRELTNGRPALLVFAYYECPMLCSLVLDGLVGALALLELDLDRDFEVLTVSIDPTETPELASKTKKTYESKYGRAGVAEGWHFLTGEEDAIRSLTEAAGFRYAADATSGQFAHAAGVGVLSPEGTLSRYLYGVDYPVRDLRFALVEASAGKVGTLADQVLLYCYQYDPSTGRYSAAALGAVRTGGIATVLGIAGYVWVATRRERRRARSSSSPGVKS